MTSVGTPIRAANHGTAVAADGDVTVLEGFLEAAKARIERQDVDRGAREEEPPAKRADDAALRAD